MKNEETKRPGFEKHPPLNFSDYKQEMLSSKTATELPECKIFDPKASVIQPDSISMASYPRSGNTLMRTWVERVTGIWSGSDGHNQVSLHQALMDIGLEGEGVADKRL